MNKIVFFDIDGTLYDHINNCIPALHMKALQELKENGYKVCLCTGRSLPLIENLGILPVFQWDGIIAGNGSFVYDQNLNLLYENVISFEDTKKIFELSKKYDAPLFVSGSTIYVTKLNEHMQYILDKVHVHCKVQEKPEEKDKLSIISWCSLNYKNEVHLFSDLNNIKPIVTRLSMDLIKRDADKYYGIQILLKHFNMKDYIAFGDGMNDVDMLQHARMGVIMNNGDPNAKKLIQEICPDCKDGGIYTYLKEKKII